MRSDSTARRAVLFLAVSTGAQATDDRESLPEQRRILEAATARFGWRVVDTITVPGFSRSWYTYREFCEAAAADGMPDALRLFEHWQARDFDVLAALNTTRLGRDQSILAEVIRRTIDAGAVVYTEQGGFIDAQSQRMHIAMSGYATGAEMDELRRRHKFGMIARTKRGLPGSQPPATHRLIRDERGRGVQLVVDESKRRLLDDMADLVIRERIALSELSAPLAARGHPVIAGRTLHKWLRTPMTWGHSARFVKERHMTHGWTWVIDERQPVPEGVLLIRDTHEAAWTGEVAEQLKAELLRRNQVSAGNRALSASRLFSGLLVCAECGGGFSYHVADRATLRGPVTHTYLYCAGRKARTCPAPLVRLPAILPDLCAFMDRVIAAPDVQALFAVAEPADPTPARMVALQAEQEAAENRARALIRKQAQAPAALWAMYDDELRALADQLVTLQSEHLRLAASAQHSQQRDQAASRLRSADPAWFWSLPEPAQNQLLHALLDRARFVVHDGRIVDVRVTL